MSTNKEILVAGIGNIFLGDDAFGVEVVRELSEQVLPSHVQVVDFGIRSYDLAYALIGPYAAIILVDAVRRGNPPGTLYLMQPELQGLSARKSELPDAHSLDVVSAVQMAQTVGEITASLYLVGCEPGILEAKDGEMGLSEPVRATIPRALEQIDSLITRLLSLKSNETAGLTPA